MRRFTLAKFFLDPCWYFYIFWFPEYLKRARGFDMKEIAFVAAVPFISADIGNLAGGFFARFLIGRGFSLRAARSVTIACFCVCMTAAIPAVLVTSPAASVALVSLATFGYTGCSANMLSLPADIFPKSAVSTVYGVASMGAGLGGVVFLKATGLVLDRYQSYVPVFMGFGLMPLVCAAIIWRTLRTEPR
jgi:ACS family hexuronate transporter-like MFS transporter